MYSYVCIYICTVSETFPGSGSWLGSSGPGAVSATIGEARSSRPVLGLVFTFPARSPRSVQSSSSASPASVAGEAESDRLPSPSGP